MKTFLSFFLILFSSLCINAQCDGCVDDGTISHNGKNMYSAISAQAYFWEICEGSGTISGSNTGSSVTVNCVGNIASTLKVTRFVNGECIESCIEFECGGGGIPCNCNSINDNCVNITIEGTPFDCETAIVLINSNCLPDCYDYVDWRFRLGGIDETFYNQIASYSWSLPPTGYFNYNLVVTAYIHLDNGQICEATSQVTLTCSEKTGDDGGGIGLIDHNSNNSIVTVYPNPVEKGGNLQINQESIEGADAMEIIDFNGKVVQVLPKNENNIQINSALNAGIYFIGITKGKEVTRLKFVIK